MHAAACPGTLFGNKGTPKDPPRTAVRACALRRLRTLSGETLLTAGRRKAPMNQDQFTYLLYAAGGYMNKRVRWRSGGMAALREVCREVAEMLDVPVQHVADGRCVDVQLDDDLVMDVALIFEHT